MMDIVKYLIMKYNCGLSNYLKSYTSWYTILNR